MIAFLLGFGVLISYFDRVNVSVSQTALHATFGVTTVEFGYLLGAYSWTYCFMQLPCGLLLDRFGVRKIGLIGSFLWSVACFGGALSTGVPSFFTSRLVLGAGEAPSFPGSSKATGYWFPNSERSLATAIYDGCAKLGPAIGVPLMGLLLLHFGWRWTFAATGFLSVAYFLFFWRLYRNPAEDRSLSERERQFILRGGANAEGHARAGESASLAYLLGQRKVGGLLFGFAAYNYTFYLLLSWLPSYLYMALHVNLLDSVLYTSIPWLAGALTEFVIGGWLIDALIHRGWDASRVRQTILVAGTSLGLGLVGAARAHTIEAAVAWITLSLAGLSAAAGVGWSIPSLIAPKGSVGTLGGLLNFCNQLAAIAAPIVTGYIVAFTHSFAGAFITAGAFLALGIAAYIVLLGRIEPIPEPA
jgi:MFS transporter, ACS family, D-galactonate transporter